MEEWIQALKITSQNESYHSNVSCRLPTPLNNTKLMISILNF